MVGWVGGGAAGLLCYNGAVFSFALKWIPFTHLIRRGRSNEENQFVRRPLYYSSLPMKDFENRQNEFS